MRTRTWTLLAGAVAIAVAAAFWPASSPLETDATVSPIAQVPAPLMQADEARPTTLTSSVSSLTGHASDESVEDSVEVREYRRYTRFQTDIRGLFEATRNAPDPGRVDEARRLAQTTHWAEQEEYLLPIEAFGIHVGLLRAVVSDPDDRAARIKTLQRHYVQAAERERAATLPDPRMAVYQRRVTNLVSERRSSGASLSPAQRRALRQDMTALRREIFTN